MLLLLLQLFLLPVARAEDIDTLTMRHAPEAWLAGLKHKDVEVLSVGNGPMRAYVFMPRTPAPQGAPLVLLNHGWLGMNPKNFGALIDLLVRRGAVLIYPVYQDGNATAPQDVTRLAGQASAAALALLQMRNPEQIDTNRTLYIGFSMGAAISLNFALAPQRFGLPAPRAVLLFAPGDAHHVAKGEAARSIIGPIEQLPVGLPVVIATGAADTGIGLPTARLLASRLCHLPADRRLLLIFPSDQNGDKRVLAGHGSPGAPDSRYDFPDSRATVPNAIHPREGFESSPSLNQLDFYGYWRLAGRLLDWVGGADYPQSLFGDSPENRFLGRWPDGRPYTPASIENPCS
ncbi:MAG: hypothetical protein CGU28_15365 [Candidatus Dactylopiibacterium carminicum]|uniref:Alpha/beta hydrolase n=1 Tax=Candidatus Dactylopiibacterium carminicum TaxID=857335 RepID=A0A272EN92_9RHOO|nr:hypothetical protein BGI27_15505 [Candidatus Dactylopiibacterium carminicum]PAS91585.1 MAG: hypothetical protein CGU29_15690 [Candidatus Dactylopiibacterium carminicum]PAS93289.1 MAG: hypothetical protein CGU28_15365 [Candidatus Dactylopiibacterium carminicum]PAS96329.1 MAG: hypothetical protein BSR46_15540 [Candidatus Dactylopiibacterium carminicum]